VVDPNIWPILIDTDDLPKKKLMQIHQVTSPDETCYVDFSVSTTGNLAGIKVIKSIIRVYVFWKLCYGRVCIMFRLIFKINFILRYKTILGKLFNKSMSHFFVYVS